MFHYIWMLIVGIVVGLIASWFMGIHMGLLMAGALGIVGSIVGGFIGGLISKPADGAMFHPAGIIMSIIGAMIVLFAVSHLLPALA